MWGEGRARVIKAVDQEVWGFATMSKRSQFPGRVYIFLVDNIIIRTPNIVIFCTVCA
jgi:hypothetical protein